MSRLFSGGKVYRSRQGVSLGTLSGQKPRSQKMFYEFHGVPKNYSGEDCLKASISMEGVLDIPEHQPGSYLPL